MPARPRPVSADPRHASPTRPAITLGDTADPLQGVRSSVCAAGRSNDHDRTRPATRCTGQLGLLLLLAAALLGAVVGRYLWAAPRIRHLDAEVHRLRSNGSGPPEGDPPQPF